MANLTVNTHEASEGRLLGSFSNKKLLRTMYVVTATEREEYVSVGFTGSVGTISGTNDIVSLSVERMCRNWVQGTASNMVSPATVDIVDTTYYADKAVAKFATSGTIARTHEWQTRTIQARHKVTGTVKNGSATETYSSNYDSPTSSSYIEIDVLVAPKDSYAVTFDANGGDQAQCPPTLEKWHNEPLPIPECVMASDLGVFSGWSLSPEGAVAFPDGEIPSLVNEDITLYAVWDSGKYNLALMPCYGTEDAVIKSNLDVGTSYVIDPEPFRRVGFDFLGWATKEDGEPEYPDGGLFSLNAGEYRSTVSLYARWKRDAPVIDSLEADRENEDTGIIKLVYSTYISSDSYTPTVTAHVTLTPRAEGQALTRVVSGVQSGRAFLLEDIDDASYDISVYIDDGLVRSDNAHLSLAIGTGSYTLDFAPGGKGMGVFMACPKGADGRGEGLHVNAENGFNVYGLEGYGDKTLQDLLDEVKRAAALAAHPVGSYYWSDDPKDPGDKFGGEWEQITDAFLYAKGTATDAGKKAAGERGGEEAHKLTAAESGSPSHKHPVDIKAASSGSHSHLIYYGQSGYYTTIPANRHYLINVNKNIGWTTASLAGQNTFNGMPDAGAHQHDVKGDTGDNTAADAAQAHNNMPPYIAAYCWRRVA